MKRILKYLTLIAIVLGTSACALPLQEESYPAWTTKGIIEEETDIYGNKINGYENLSIGSTADTNLYKITVKEVNKFTSYNNYEANNDNYLLIATIEITNKTDKKQYLYLDDFPLMWNLDQETQSYVYSLDDKSIDSNILYDKKEINSNETITIKTVYEMNNKEEKPFAINYTDLYDNDIEGDSYYFIIK